MAELIPTGKPAHTRDLAAQTIGLHQQGPTSDKLTAKIRSNVQQLLSLQRQSGHWSVKFDPAYPITEMQTGESLYALSLAGLKPEQDPMRRGIVALLSRQQDFGGWFDVNPYEQFRTPFRETQWALDRAFKVSIQNQSPLPKGWNAPLGKQPATLRSESPAMLIRDMERIWDAPGADLETLIVAQLGHESPLVRCAPAPAGRRRSPGRRRRPIAKAWTKCLGDESKVVRRASAEALRMIGNRLNGSRRPGETKGQAQLVTVLRDALRSPDDRTRRGAARVFAAHFRELSQEHALADSLLERLDDSDPVVAMEAIKGLWRWWYWRAEPSLRNRIEGRLIAELSETRHPWVRRNLIEALYIIGDENIRYLDKNWIPVAGQQGERQHYAYRGTAYDGEAAWKRPSTCPCSAKASRLQREGVLAAMSEFFERPVLGGRIGNDLEPMLFHDEIARQIPDSPATAQMGDPNPTIRTLALQALVSIRGDRSAHPICIAVATALVATNPIR